MGNARCDVHRVDKAQPLLDAALPHKPLDNSGDIHESATGRHFKPKMFGQRFHCSQIIPAPSAETIPNRSRPNPYDQEDGRGEPVSHFGGTPGLSGDIHH